MTVQRYFTMVLNFVTMAVAARLLRPEEVGVAVIGSMIATMVLSLREFANMHFLVQKADLTEQDQRSAFSLLALITFFAAIALATSASWIAKSYGEPTLSPYLRIVCLGACLDLIAMPIVGLLQREMAFGKIAALTAVQASMAAIVAISGAATGFSSMSFAWAWFASSASAAAMALYLRRDWSIFRPLTNGWQAVLTFGGYYGANQILARIYETVPSMILGRAISTEAVGYYNRAFNICQLADKVFLSGVMAVAVPAFSAKKRSQSSLKEPYLRGVAYITVLQWPALICLALLAHPIVDVVLGSQWGKTVPLIQLMAITYLFAFTFELNFPVLVAVGAVRDLFFRALIVWPASAAILSLGAYFGLKAMVLSMFLALPFQAYVAIYAVQRHLDVSWYEILLTLRKSAVVTLICALGPALMIAAFGFRFDLSIAAGIGAGFLAVTGWLIGLWMTNHPFLEELSRALRLVRQNRLSRVSD
jgi:O-antigen/teichoic acid export membrane protein